MFVGRGISGPSFLKQESPTKWLCGFVDDYQIFWNILSLPKVTVCPFLPKTMLRKQHWKCCFAKIIEGLYINPPFNNSGDLTPWCVSFKENKVPFCICIYYLICSCPCLCPNWSSDKPSDDCLTLIPGKLSSTSIVLSPRMVSLGWWLLPSLLEWWELQVWIYRIFSHVPLIFT